MYFPPSEYNCAALQTVFNQRSSPLEIYVFVRMCRRLSIPKYINIQAVMDTKLLAYLLDPDSKDDLKLNHQCDRYLKEVYPFDII